MKPNPLHLWLILGVGAAGAHGMDLNTLVERSPFAPPGAKTVETPNEAPAQLEFRGIAADESGTMFSVYDLTANRGYWVREGEAGAVAVKTFDPSENLIEVEQGGRTHTLKLKRASIQAGAALPVPAPAAPTGNPPGGRPRGDQAGVTPAADAKRLEAVAAEVRRRRALRNAAQAGAQPAAPAPAAANP